MIKNYFKIAWRNLLRQKKTTLINLVGLIIGMTSSLFIFMWVQNEYSFDSYHPGADRIYRLTSFDPKSQHKETNTPYLTGETINNQIPEIENLTRIRPITGLVPSVKVGDHFFKETHAAYVDDHWFELFQYTFVNGSAQRFNQPNRVVISQSIALKYFGTTDDIIDKTIRVDGIDYSIQGVFKNAPTNSSFPYDMFFPIAARHTDPFWRNWDLKIDRNAYQTYVKFAQTINSTTIASKIVRFMPESWQNNHQLLLRPLQDIHFENDLNWSDLPRGNEKMVSACALLGILLLLVSCINYVNLTTANASLYLKSVSVRKIVGAKRRQLFLQCILESVLLSTGAFLCSILLANLLLPVFNQLVNNHFSLAITHTHLWYLVIIFWICSILTSSIYPAILLSSFKPTALFMGKSLSNKGNVLLRKILVIFQFSTSIVLIIGTLVLYKQMQFINSQYKSYDKSHIFSFDLPNHESSKALKSYFKQALLEESSIQQVAFGSSLIKLDNPWGPFDWDGRNPNRNYPISLVMADADFKDLFALKLTEGRWFHEGDVDKKNFVLNETAVSTLGIHQPIIGQRFISDQDTGLVVGVVKDFQFQGMHEKISPLVFSNDLWSTNTILVKTEPGKQTQARVATEKIFRNFYPETAFDYQFVQQEFDYLYQKEYLSATLLTILAGLSIFISCLGLYGLVTFSADQRNKEIGIRKVLGATVAGIVVLLSKDFIKLVGFGLLLACPVAWWAMDNWLADFAYKISLQWWMFATAGSIAILIALITTTFQSVKAALANPVDSLRNE